MSLAVNAVVAGLAVFVFAAASIWYLTVDRQSDQIKIADLRHEWTVGNTTADDIRVSVTFENRYNVEATLLGWSYELQVHRKRIAYAESVETGVARPNGDLDSTLVLTVPRDFVSDWVQGHMTQGESTQARFRGVAVFEVSHRNITVTFGPSVEWTTSLKGDLEDVQNCPQSRPDPCIARTAANWQSQGESTVLELSVGLNNPNDDPIVIGARSAEIVWGTVPVGRADAHEVLDIPDDTVKDVEFRIYLVHELLKDWWADHVRRCESSGTSLRVAFAYEVEEPTPTPTPTTTTSARPTSSSSPSPPSTTSNSPTQTPPSTTQTTPTETPPSPTNTSDSDAPTPLENEVLYVIDLHVEPTLQLQPQDGEAGSVNWEFAGPLLRTELVCGST